MRTANDKLIFSVRAVFKWQLILLGISLLLMGAYWLVAQKPFFAHALWSFLYGAVLAIVATVISAVSAKYAGDAAYNHSSQAMLVVYLGAFKKLVLVAAGIAFALIKLQLNPIWILVGFIVMHLAQVIVAVTNKRY